MNYRITIAYDGTDFQGWQMQHNLSTIQGKITDALEKIVSSPVIVHGAGRTDAGVHASGQVASFHLHGEYECRKLSAAINGNLPPEIRVLSAEPVADEFHARFDATEKTYCYQIETAAIHDPLQFRYAWQYAGDFNLPLLRETAGLLLGTHDFSAFTVNSCETRTRVRTLTNFSLESIGSLHRLSFTGSGFLRYQVRRMVSTLMECNRRGWQPESFAEISKCSEKTKSAALAPAKGLTLMKVGY